MTKVPLLLDTDIGSDIDDAVCLSYLLKQPRCEIVGITTVSGKPDERAALADAVCRAAGKPDIPVFAGNDIGLLRGVVQPDCPQTPALKRFPHKPPAEFRKYSAVEFMRRTIHARPGEITLLGIGPMTNIGLLFASDPEIPKLLKSLWLMCGVFQTPHSLGIPAEWNARCDPLAAAMVYRGQVPTSVSIGLDVTMRCRKPGKECIERFRQIGGGLEVVAAMTELTHAKGEIVFHDPLAGACIFEPDLCTYQDGKVEVEIKSDHVPGMTHFLKQTEDKPHRVAVDVNIDAFFENYFSVVSS